MKSLKNKVRGLVIAGVLIMGAFVGTNVNAQVVDDTTLKVCEEVADKAKRLEIENTSLKAQLSISKQETALEKERTANKEEQVQIYKKLYENTSKIDTNSGLIIENLRFQVNDYKNENADLRRENDKLRSSRDTRSLIFGGLGFGLGWYAGSKK